MFCKNTFAMLLMMILICLGVHAQQEVTPAGSGSSLLTTGTLSANLLPQPWRLEEHGGFYAIGQVNEQCTLSIPDPSAHERLSRHLAQALGELGLPGLEAQQGQPAEDYRLTLGKAPIPPARPSALPPHFDTQGYQLRIAPKGLLLCAPSEEGFFYGLATLRQLERLSATMEQAGLPCLDIIDGPILAMRGFHEDYGRDQLPTMEDHKRSIRTLAAYKMNTYMFYIEPDHFVYKFDPDLSPDYDRFTTDEIRELAAYAKQYYVQIIPVVELLGHMDQFLRHERYRSVAELETGGMDLCPTSPQALQLVKNIIDELAPAFGAVYFHAGLDESFAIGKGRSAQAVAQKGIARVYADYYNQVNALIKAHGQTMIMYGDIVLNHAECLDYLDKDIVLMDWNYFPQPVYHGLARFESLGFTRLGLSGLWDWNELYPFYSVALKNMDLMTAQCVKSGAIGHLVSSWGDGYRWAAGVNLSEWNQYGVVYCGAISWSNRPIAMEDFSARFARDFFGCTQPELAAALTTLGQAQGEDLAYVSKARYLFHGDLVAMLFGMLEADTAQMDYWHHLKKQAQITLGLLKDVQPARNADVLESIDLSAAMLETSADMALAFRQIAQSLKAGELDQAKAIETLRAIKNRHQALYAQYKTIYLRSNRPINMTHIDESWTFTLGMFDQLINEIEDGTLMPSYTEEPRIVLDFETHGQPSWTADRPASLTLQNTGSGPQAEILPLGNEDKGFYLHLPQGAVATAVDSQRSLDFQRIPFAIQTWVRHNGQPSSASGATLVSAAYAGAGWRVWLDDQNRLCFSVLKIGEVRGFNASVPPDGQWHHIAVNFINCTKVEFYVDGHQAGQAQLAAILPPLTEPTLYLGNGNDLRSSFAGDLTRLQIHAGALSEQNLDATW